MKLIVLLLLILAAAWLGIAWDVMLTVGIAHRDWWHFIPLMGYHTALAVTSPAMAFGVLVGVLRGITGKE